MARRRKREHGTCCICGFVGELSFEHVPPEAAFNDQRVFEANVYSAIKARTLDELDDIDGSFGSQRGAGRYTLCETCNSNTGAWYGTAYVDWARQGMDYALLDSPGKRLKVGFSIHPLRVVKQALAMFASANGPDFFGGSPELTRYILNKEQGGFPEPLRLFVFLLDRSSSAARQTGISGVANLESAGIRVFSEIVFPPFGLVLSVDGNVPDARLQEITHFGRYGYHERADVVLDLPILPVTTYLPGDYRSRDELAADLARPG